MKKIFLFSLLTIFLTPNIAKATEAYDFVSTIIDSFEITNIARHRFLNNDFEKLDSTAQMTAVTVFKKELEKAAQRIEPFTKSKDKNTSLFARAYSLTYTRLIKNQDAVLDLYEKILNNPGTEPGTVSRQIAEIMGEVDTLWREFFETTTLFTNMLVTSKGDSGKLTHLIITSQEKKLIMDNLVRSFGDDVKVFPKAGIHSIDGSAASLYYFLDKKGFKPSDVE